MRPTLATVEELKAYKVWLWFLLGFTLLYIVMDFSFNASLLNIASGYNIDEDGFRKVEITGRILSSIGCSLLAFSLWKIRYGFTLKKVFFRFLLTLATVGPLFYYGSEQAIENYLIKPSTAEQRAVAHTLDLAKRLEMSGVSEFALYGHEMKDSPHHAEAMTHAATFPLVAVLNKDATSYFSNNYIDRLYKEAVKDFVDLHSLRSSSEGYQVYLDQQDRLEKVYQKYLDSGNEVAKKVSPISDAEFNEIWVPVRDELRSNWAKLQPVMAEAMESAKWEVNHQTNSLMNIYQSALQRKYDHTLERIETPEYTNRYITRRGLYGRIVKKNRDGSVYAQEGVDGNPFTDFCGGKGRIGRTCHPTRSQMYQHLWDYANMDLYATKHSVGWPVTMQTYQDFLNTERVGREVRSRIQSKSGLSIPSSFDREFGGSPSVTRRYVNAAINDKALSVWHREMAKALGVSTSSLSGLTPNMSFQEFIGIDGVEQAIRRHTGGYYSPNMRIGMSEKEFMDVVMRDMANEMEKMVMRRYSRSTGEFMSTRDGREDGMTAYRATIIPPVALILSLFFSLVALVRLPLMISEIYLMSKPMRRDFHKEAKGVMVVGIVAIISLPFLLVPTSSFEDGFLVGMAFANEVSPVVEALYHWLYVAEPYLYRVGQTFLELSGMNNLEIIHASDYAEALNWR